MTTTPAGQEVLLRLPAFGQVKALNSLGVRVWTLADGSRSVAGIVDVICLEYDVARELAQKQTLTFVEELQRKGLVWLRADA